MEGHGDDSTRLQSSGVLCADGVVETREADCLRCVLVCDGPELEIGPTMVRSTRGPRAREEPCWWNVCRGTKGGESLAFLSVILSFPVKPFSRRYRRLFRTWRWSLRLCVLCLVFGWFRVQAATMIEGRERTGDFGPWRVPYNISARGAFFVPERNPCLWWCHHFRLELGQELVHTWVRPGCHQLACCIGRWEPRLVLNFIFEFPCGLLCCVFGNPYCKVPPSLCLGWW